MTDVITRLRQSLTSLTEHADDAISAIEREEDEALLLALGQMAATYEAIRTLVKARIHGDA